MSNSRTYSNVSPAVAAEFYKKALDAGCQPEGPQPSSDNSFWGLVNFRIKYNRIHLSVAYAGTSQRFTVVIEHKDFPFGVVPDDTVFDELEKYLPPGIAAPHQAIWANTAQPKQAVWGNAVKPEQAIWANEIGFAHPNFVVGHIFATGNPSFAARDAMLAVRSFKPANIKKYYGITGDGAGQTIALIELGGAYYEQDLRAAGINPADVVPVYVDGAKQEQSDADGEVALDIQVAKAVAPAAKIRVYFAPNTDVGFYNAVRQAYADIGGYCPTTAASGDNGYLDGASTKTCDFPASAPYAIACGGTLLTGSVESVWNNLPRGGATGGGVSTMFPVPPWQEGLTFQETGKPVVPLTGRGVPDVAGNADPHSGYIVYVNGQKSVIGGTSAVAPLWAGVFACLQSQAGFGKGAVSISWGAPETSWTAPARSSLASLIELNAHTGNILPHLYAHPEVCTDIGPGPGQSNGDYLSTKGWDAVTGLGSPHGGRIKGLLTRG